MRISLEVDGGTQSTVLLVGLPRSRDGSPSMFSARLCFGVWGNSGALPKNPPLPRMLTEQTLKTSRDDSAFLRVCGFNFESTLF